MIIRSPAVAGMFYNGRASALSLQVDDLLQRAGQEHRSEAPMALVAPHAGYQYSGFTAAKAYALLGPASPRTVVVVSPSHREYFDGISVYCGDAYRTPLGDLPVDAQLRDLLLEGEDLIVGGEIGHRSEHAIEVQLPFLQKTAGSVSIVPIVMGDQRRDYCIHLGRRLAEVLRGKSVLLVASTDLSHYHSYEEAVRLDAVAMKDIAEMEDARLLDDLEQARTEACGGGPAAAVVAAARELGAARGEIMHHCNSGDVTGDRSAVVGYLSAAFWRTN